MKTEKAIAYAKRVYPNVTKTVQLQIASAYIAGATEGMRLTTEKVVQTYSEKEDNSTIGSNPYIHEGL